MLLPVDDDRRDLLVHEDEDGTEQRGDEGDDGGPPGVGPHWVYNPATIIPGWLQMVKDKTRRENAVEQIFFSGEGARPLISSSSTRLTLNLFGTCSLGEGMPSA